jgi:hypothetical protein
MSAATETIAFLRNYNSWRRGDETLEMPSPAEIGATIDDAVNLLRKHENLERRVERLTIALRDAISTYNPNRKETLVTAERQEAWIAALKEDAK